MSYKLVALVIAGLALARIAPAQSVVTNSVTFTADGASVPDGDINGLALTAEVSGVEGSIFDVSVTFDLRGGNNSDLYAYLSGPNGGFSVLLNRVGLGATSANGYEDTGFHITLSDGASANVHDYQSVAGYQLNGLGQLTGTWAPDGRNIDPLSAPSLFDSASASQSLQSFIGTDPNGLWTFYIADVSGGAQTTVENVQLNIRTVPEPGTPALLAAGVVAFFAWRTRSSRR